MPVNLVNIRTNLDYEALLPNDIVALLSNVFDIVDIGPTFSAS